MRRSTLYWPLFPKNFWDLTTTDIDNIQNAIATQYDFQNVKDIL